MLFLEAGEGSSSGYDLYVRGTDGSPPVKLGEGAPRDLSPDGKWVLAQSAAPGSQLVRYPIAAGEKTPLSVGRLELGGVTGQYLPDGAYIVFTARETGSENRVYLMDLAKEHPRALSPEGYSSVPRGVSPDGKYVVVTRVQDQTTWLQPLDGGDLVPIPGLRPDDLIGGWSENARFLYVHSRGVPVRVFRLEVATGKREHWRDVIPDDAAGLSHLRVLPTPNGEAYVCNYVRTLSDLYVVHGLQ